MKTSRTIFAILLLSVAFIWVGSQKASAQACNFGSNVIPCPGFVLGQENVPFSFGTFTGSEEWMALGKAPFPVPSGDVPYGVRLQRNLSQALFQLKRRSSSASSPMDANVYFGTTRNSDGKTPPLARMDFDYVFQDQSAFIPTITNTNIMTLIGANSKQISPTGPSLVCPFPFPGGPGAPCFGRVGIERVNPTFTLDVNGIGRFTALIVTSDARFKKDVKTIENGMNVIRDLRGATYNFVNSDDLEGFDFAEGRRPGFLAQEVEAVLPEVVYTDDDGYKGVDYIGIIPYLVEAVKNLDDENATLRAEMEDLRMQLDNNNSSKGAGSFGEMRDAELFQNVPNPFNEETRINYFLPETVQNATMIVFDMSGRQVRNIDINTTGQGTVTIGATDLEAGMYIYSLIADGKEIASKRMILTK
jgi:hypothetical protein